MSFSDEKYDSKYERAMDEAAVDGEVLGEGSFTANYGSGLRLDISSFLKESSRAQDVLSQLDNVERFVLLSYFLLRKTEKHIADLVGLNECRFNQFLENLIRKVGALVVFGNPDPEGWAEAMDKAELGVLHPRRVEANRPTHALKGKVSVKTVDVLIVFMKTRSFLKVGGQFGAYYVDLRRGLEDVAEKLKARKDLASISLGEFIGSQVQFAGVKEEGYAGRMGKLPPVIQVKDPEVLSRPVVRMGEPDADHVFTPRALGALKGGN